VHPDALDTQLNAFLDDLLGDFGVGENENSIRLLGNRLQVRIAQITLKGRDARIDGADSIACRFSETPTTAIFF
jgi:hypothetical protein